MHGARAFIEALAIVLGVAAVTSVLFQRLRQPIVLGYLLAGLVVGPHLPIPLVADPEIVHALSELGVILLMFSLGLEFSLRKLWQVGPTAGVTAVIQCSLMIWLGLLVGAAFGWTRLEGLFAGAIIAISSTTIIAKAFDEQKIGGRLREIVVGVLIVEDLIAILLMALLTGIASGVGMNAASLGATLGKLAAFLVGLVAIGLFVVPRVVRAVVRLGRPEITLVTSVAICFGISLLAQHFGYSVALGAFLAGSLVSESGKAHQIERLVVPLRDLFGAVFFVSVGMMIDPKLIAEHAAAVAVLTAVVIAGKLFGVGLGAFLTGNGVRTSVQAGMSLAQIGEFSFIIAGLGLSLGATREFLYPVAVAVSAITTLSTPFLIRASPAAATFVDRKLPRPLQTFAGLYGSWLEGLSQRRNQRQALTGVKRWSGLLLVDTAALAGIAIGASLAAPRIEAAVGSSRALTRWGIALAAVVLAVPFVIGVVRITGRLAAALATAALPVQGRVDLAAAPRKALALAVQLACVLGVSVPLLAVTQPFLPSGYGLPVVLAGLAALGIGFWRSARGLEGHLRAGAQVIAEALARQTHDPGEAGHGPEEIRSPLSGIGDPVSLQIEPSSRAVGKSLAELQLRALTGATVIALRRGEEQHAVPDAREVLHAGDVVALAGTREAVRAAAALLGSGGDEVPAARG